MSVQLRVLSLGAGVQSTTLALMAAAGEIERPDLAIFADTKWESRRTYDHLTWLAERLPFEVHVTSAGNLRDAIATRRNTGGRFAAIPWHTVNPDGSHGMGRRQCSSEYKLEPIMRAIRVRLGKGRRTPIAAGAVEVLIGISRDEAHRMREARQRYMINRYPLVDLGMRRWDCLQWLERHGYPRPPKSSCIGCPFHGWDQVYWRQLRDERPEEWADAVEADRQLRGGAARSMRAIEYMHPARVPLDQVDLDQVQLSLFEADGFGNECEGVCGV